MKSTQIKVFSSFRHRRSEWQFGPNGNNNPPPRGRAGSIGLMLGEVSSAPPALRNLLRRPALPSPESFGELSCQRVEAAVMRSLLAGLQRLDLSGEFLHGRGQIGDEHCLQ